MTANVRADLIAELGALPSQLRHLVGPLSRAQLSTPFLANEWTVAQNVHHLADSHMNSYIRCKLIATEDQPPLKPYDQDQWAAFADATSAEIEGSLQLLTALHARWVSFWQNLPDEAWARTGHHPAQGIVTLDDQLRLYVAHGKAHLDQIARTLEAEHR